MQEGGAAAVAALSAIPLLGTSPRVERGAIKAFRLLRSPIRSKATPSDRDAIVKRIRGLYGQTGALLLQEQLDKFIGTGDVAARQKWLDDHRQDLTADAREREARQEQAYDLVRGIVGGFGGRRAGSGSRVRKPIPVGKLPPGPGFKPNRTFITPEELRKLPDKGVIDPQSVRTSQEKFSDKFGAPIIPGVPESRKVD